MTAQEQELRPPSRAAIGRNQTVAHTSLTMPPTTQSDILHFWFSKLTPKQHFAKDTALDESIRTRFGPTLEAAARCELFPWRATP